MSGTIVNPLPTPFAAAPSLSISTIYNPVPLAPTSTSSAFRRCGSDHTPVPLVPPSPSTFRTSLLPPPSSFSILKPSALPLLNPSRRFALGARNVCLVGENPTCSVPALWGYEGLWSYDYEIEYISPMKYRAQKVKNDVWFQEYLFCLSLVETI